jgi:hypothetical protein
MFTSRSNQKSETKVRFASKPKKILTDNKQKVSKEFKTLKPITKINEFLEKVKKNPSDNMVQKPNYNTIVYNKNINVKPNSKSNSNVSELKAKLNIKSVQSPLFQKLAQKKDTVLMKHRAISKDLFNSKISQLKKKSTIEDKLLPKRINVSNLKNKFNFIHDNFDCPNTFRSSSKLILSNLNNTNSLRKGSFIIPSPHTERMKMIELNFEENSRLESEIIQSIKKFGSLLRAPYENLHKYEQLLKNEENVIKLKGLNEILNKLNFNAIKILSNLLSNDSKSETKEKISLCLDLNEYNNNVLKEDLISDIYVNSDLRIKRYTVLFDFLSDNIKEIKEIVIQNTKTKSVEKNTLLKSSSSNNLKKSLKERECAESQNLVFSSLSLLNSTVKKDNKETVVWDFNESEIEEDKINILNNNNLHNKSLRINNNELSLIISTISSEFYKKLLEESGGLNKNINFSNEMNDIIKEKENLEHNIKNFFSSLSNFSSIKDYNCADNSPVIENVEIMKNR